MAGINKKLVLPEMRLSYCHLFEARAVAAGADEKFSVSILIPKSETKLKKQLDDIFNELVEKNQDILKTKKNLKNFLRDGDEEREEKAYEGHWFIGANAQRQPYLVDKDRQEIINQREIYSGMYGRVSVNFYAYNTGGNKGIACALNAVQKTKDGEPLGGTYTKEQAMEDFDDDNSSSNDDDDMFN
jgi:hypothetical protein